MYRGNNLFLRIWDKDASPVPMCCSVILEFEKNTQAK